MSTFDPKRTLSWQAKTTSIRPVAKQAINLGNAQDQQLFNFFSVPFDPAGSLLGFSVLQRSLEVLPLFSQDLFLHVGGLNRLQDEADDQRTNHQAHHSADDNSL